MTAFDPKRATWSVQATVNEPLELLVAFVAHYLELGADVIYLYLDAPHPEAEAAFSSHPRVKVTICDDVYWAKLTPKGRPSVVPARQKWNSRHVYSQINTDWLLLCDADEYLVAGCDLGELLGRQPIKTEYLRIRVAEKILEPDVEATSIFDGIFRTAQQKGASLALEIYGRELAPMLERIVAGHDIGKSIIRRGLDCVLGIHQPKRRTIPIGSSQSVQDLQWTWMPEAYIAHFDALTPLYYLVKLLARHLIMQSIQDTGRQPNPIHHRSREAQMLFAVAACATKDPAAVTAALHRPTREQMAALSRHGLVVDLNINPVALTAKHFPALRLDFSPAAFDSALRLRHAQTLARMGVT